jgi:FkbM family methyltransferase
VFSFEPEGKNFSRLVHNQLLNDLEGMRAFCLAVGKSTRIDELFITGKTAGDSQHNIGGENRLYPRAHAGIQGSMVVALDALCYSHGLPVPQHLKIDVDGLEEEIIEGARRLLRDRSLRTVMVEISDHRDKASPIYEAMSDAGFEISGRAKRAYENDLIVARNVWFSRRAESARALNAV